MSPPPLARRLLELVLPAGDRHVFPEELDELFRERVRTVGPVRARWWYRRQVTELALRLVVVRARALLSFHPLGERFSMDVLIRDLRHAGRGLLRRPVFTVVAVVSLALGIGANTAVFSLVNAVLLRPLPVEDPASLVEIYTSDSNGFPYSSSSYPDVRDLREAGDAVFEDVVSYQLVMVVSERDGRPAMLMGEAVSGNYFDALGIHAVRGRVIAPEEGLVPGAAPVVVLSHAFWEERFGASEGVLGRTLRLNRLPYTVVGVAPEDFRGMTPGLVPDFWAPDAMIGDLNPGATDRLETRGSRSLFAKGRLRDDVTVERANEWLGSFSRRLGELHPGTNKGREMQALPSSSVSLHPSVDRALVPVAALLLGVVGIVLLITCANLAGFLLARAEDRRRDVAVRVALGAGRASVVRQLLTETLLLAAVGGVAGVLLARAMVAGLMRFKPPLPIPVNLDVGLDGRVLLFAVAATAVAGLAFGIIPALRATGSDPAAALREGRTPEGTGPGGSRLRNGLVVAQVALSFVLLVGAGLFVRSLQAARATDTGFDTGPAAVVWPDFQMSGVDDADGPALWLELERRLLEDPVIDEVAYADVLPLGANVHTTAVEIPGMPSDRDDGAWDVDQARVSPSYFATMDVEILRGRAFEAADRDTTSTAAIVSRAFESRFMPDGAVGRTVTVGDRDLTVVGVAADTRVRTLNEAPRPRIYFPDGARYVSSYQIVARGSVDAERLVATVGAVVEDVRPGAVVIEAKTMEEHLALMLFPPRMAALLLTAFGSLALLLAAVGLYGVVSYTVARRTREMGIRLSLGAAPRDVVLLVVRGGMGLVLVGAALGLVLALLAGSALSTFLIGVSGRDLTTFVSIPVVLMAVGLLATCVPAFRTTRLQPADVLRGE